MLFTRDPITPQSHVPLCTAYNARVMWPVPTTDYNIQIFQSPYARMRAGGHAGSTRVASMKAANAYGCTSDAISDTLPRFQRRSFDGKFGSLRTADRSSKFVKISRSRVSSLRREFRRNLNHYEREASNSCEATLREFPVSGYLN